MKSTKTKISSLFIFALILQFIAYFGFNSAYFNYKNLNDLPDFYNENVYKYRFLGVDMFNWFYNHFSPILDSLKENTYFSNAISSLGTNFYISLFVFNTIFLLASLFIIYKTFKLPNFSKINELQKFLISLLVIFFFTISFYVITPYDSSSYFYLLLSLYWLILFFNTYNFSYIILFSIMLAFSTCNRETSALGLALLYALGLAYYSGSIKELIKRPGIFIIPVVIFLLTYFGIRYLIGGTEVIQGTYLAKNLLQPKNILGIVFFLICTKWILDLSENKNLQQYFLFFSLPYLVVIFIGGILWEIRLFIPVIVPMAILIKFEFKKQDG